MTLTTTTLLQAALADDATRDLTNYDGSSTTEDATILGRAAEAADGMFERLTGIMADADDTMHQGPLIACAQYYLEMWKGRDRSLIRDARDLAVTECREIKGLVSIAPQTSSPLTTDVPDEDDGYPDMSIKNFNRKPSSIINERGKSASYTANSPDD